MAGTLADLALQQHFNGGNPVQVAGEAAQTGIQMAGALQQQQANKIRLQQMQQQLDEGKFNQVTGMLNTLARSSPAVAKKLIPAMKEQLQKSGTNVDPSVLDLMASDDSIRQRYAGISQALKGQAMQDPDTMQQALQAFGDLGEFDKGLDLLHGQVKAQQAAGIQQAKSQTALDVAKIRANATMGAAQTRSGNMNVRNQNQANNAYFQQIGKTSEAPLLSANAMQTLLNDVDLGKVNTNKSLRSDLSTKLASLINQGRAATVSGTHNVEFDSLAARLADASNFLRGAADNTIPPAQLVQLKRDVGAMKDLLVDQHQNQVDAFLQGVPEQLRPALQARSDRFMQGITGQKNGVDPSIVSKAKQAFGIGASQAEVESRIGRKLTPAELKAASPDVTPPAQPAPAQIGAQNTTTPEEDATVQAAVGDNAQNEQQPATPDEQTAEA